MDSLKKELSARESARPSHHTTDDLLGLDMSGSTNMLDYSTARIKNHDCYRPSHGHRYHSTLLSYFNGEDAIDNGAFNRWVRKLQICAEVDKWSDHEQILQLEFHLTGKAVATHDVLSSEVKNNSKSAANALRDCLQPVNREALKYAELIKRKQTQSKSVDCYAQDFEQLLLKSYGSHGGWINSQRRYSRDMSLCMVCY